MGDCKGEGIGDGRTDGRTEGWADGRMEGGYPTPWTTWPTLSCLAEPGPDHAVCSPGSPQLQRIDARCEGNTQRVAKLQSRISRATESARNRRLDDWTKALALPFER